MTIKFCFQRQKTVQRYMPFPLPNLLDLAANFTPHLMLSVSGILDQVLVNVEQRQDKPQENYQSILCHYPHLQSCRPPSADANSIHISKCSIKYRTYQRGGGDTTIWDDCSSSHFSRSEFSARVHREKKKKKKTGPF